MSRRRRGVTLLEVLVVIAIMGVLLGLLLVAIQRVRLAAVRAENMNSQKQIILAIHHFATTHEDRLPSIEGNPGSPNEGKALFVAILPYMDEWNVLREFLEGPTPVRRSINVRAYVSKLDPTVDWNNPQVISPASYALNAQAFYGSPSLLRTFPDGLSNTIAVAERYYSCGPATLTLFFTRVAVGPIRTPTFADGGPNVPRYPESPQDNYPVTSGSPPRTTGAFPGTFQVTPTPAREVCDPRFAQAMHPGGMVVSLVDGSVRTLAPAMSATTYWSAVTPAGGEVLGADW